MYSQQTNKNLKRVNEYKDTCVINRTFCKKQRSFSLGIFINIREVESYQGMKRVFFDALAQNLYDIFTKSVTNTGKLILTRKP